MSIPDIQVKRLSGNRATEAGTVNLHPLLVPLRYTRDHVIDQGSGSPVQSAMAAGVRRPCHHHAGLGIYSDADALSMSPSKRPLRTGHGDLVPLDIHLHTGRKRDWFFSDSGHINTPYTRVRRRLSSPGTSDRSLLRDSSKLPRFPGH